MAIQTLQVDQVDLKILSELQKNASLSNREIAKLVGISLPSCLRRTKELKNNFFLTGAHANINGSLLNLDLIIYCDVTLEKHTHEDLIHFQKSMHTLTCVRECHMVTGTSDFLLKIIVPDMNAYTTYLTQYLTSNNNIKSVQSRMLVLTSKKEPGLPIDLLLSPYKNSVHRNKARIS